MLADCLLTLVEWSPPSRLEEYLDEVDALLDVLDMPGVRDRRDALGHQTG